jgi:DNA-binding MarR family transcriptional regulator
MESSAADVGPMVLLTRLSRMVWRVADEERLGMRLKAFVALSYIRAFEVVQQGALAQDIHMDRNNCVLLLNELEEHGWVRRERDPEDRRRHLVSITPDGGVALAKAETAVEESADQVLGALDDDEREVLRGLLLKALLGNRANLAAARS